MFLPNLKISPLCNEKQTAWATVGPLKWCSGITSPMRKLIQKIHTVGLDGVFFKQRVNGMFFYVYIKI